MKKKNMTIEDLAGMMKKGFDETTGLIKLTRVEMAKDEDLQGVKVTVDSLWKMLDDEARFIKQMRAEYPIMVKRLERIETKLGLPHTILE